MQKISLTVSFRISFLCQSQQGQQQQNGQQLLKHTDDAASSVIPLELLSISRPAPPGLAGTITSSSNVASSMANIGVASDIPDSFLRSGRSVRAAAATHDAAAADGAGRSELAHGLS
ncbi:hypothetical protein WEH80_10790 [Actinomycetes bacterium KLBMP 9759]